MPQVTVWWLSRSRFFCGEDMIHSGNRIEPAWCNRMTGENVSLCQKFTGNATPPIEYVAAIYFTVLVTAASFVIEPLTGYRAIALLYLLLVVALGIKLRRGPVLLVAASSALAWNFFFIPTRFSLHIAKIEDLMMHLPCSSEPSWKKIICCRV